MKTRFQNSRNRCAARAGRRAVGLAAAVLLPPVVVELGVGAARTRPADRPEVLGRRQRHDPLDRHAHSLPELDRNLVGAELQLRIAGMHGRPRRAPSRAACARGRTPVANSIAPSLKYCPNEKLPSISKNVRWCPSSPTSSMSCGPEGLLRCRQQRRRRRAPGPGSTASSAAFRPSSAASCGRPRAERATPMAHACDPSTRRTRDIPRAALRSSACVDCRPDASGRSAAATSSARSCSRWAAASRAVAIASSKFRLDMNDETPLRTPAISPASFVTGYVTAPVTVRTACRRPGRPRARCPSRRRPCRARGSTRSSVSPPLWITGSSSASVCSIVFVVCASVSPSRKSA